MIVDKKVMAIVPARGGSKRLPRKNVLPLAGKPLITWSIEAAQQSQYIDEVLVSTDDQEIAAIARDSKAYIPELRPSHLATDQASTVDVLLHALENYAEDVDILVLLQPTSPLRTTELIDEALQQFMDDQANTLVSVCPCEHSPLWANTLPKNRSLDGFIAPQAQERSQELDEYYRLNGAIYILDVQHFIQAKTIAYTAGSYAYIMDNQSSVDIDTELDFTIAEVYLQRRLASH